uniref:Ig-like domain-containing protein n=1 Tax=Pelusios castaneus TaxID=367368 RepID=A0A8C8RDQ9_9SAUR
STVTFHSSLCHLSNHPSIHPFTVTIHQSFPPLFIYLSIFLFRVSNHTLPSTGMRVKALWIRGSGEDVVLDSNHPFYRGRLNMSKLDEVKQGKATLTLSQVEKRDSGIYQCCIDIQNKELRMGESTELRVMKRNRTVNMAISIDPSAER